MKIWKRRGIRRRLREALCGMGCAGVVVERRGCVVRIEVSVLWAHWECDNPLI